MPTAISKIRYAQDAHAFINDFSLTYSLLIYDTSSLNVSR